ncbi:hypothetical protein D1007_16408 [Hordeum vulgare]|nr:hypothetical protein D1007_16408 [Hordeum vulgare]
MCMLLLLTLAKPSHQQLSDAVCECYRQCYAGCKAITLPRVCKVECAGGCGGANGNNKIELALWLVTMSAKRGGVAMVTPTNKDLKGLFIFK